MRSPSSAARAQVHRDELQAFFSDECEIDPYEAKYYADALVKEGYRTVKKLMGTRIEY